jgi:hypothetical protein
MPSSLRDPRAWVLVATSLALTASCSSDPRPSGREDAPAAESVVAPAPRSGPPVDLQTVMRNTALSFRAEGSLLVAGGSTFEAAVDGAAIRVTPRISEAREAHAKRPPVTDGRGAPLSLETTLIARGDVVLADATRPVSSTLDRDGAVTLRRGTVAERIENDDAGVEQSWRFAAVPSGEGDLVVRVRATGEGYASSTEHGLHFGGNGALGLRYGTATWVDASGKRTVVTPRFVASSHEIVMVVPNEVVRASSYPAILDPTLTAEQEIDKPIAGSSAGGDQSAPSVVSAGPGKGYLAVWYDRRGVRPAIYGARVASNGTLIDDTGLPIATSVGSTQPFIAAAPSGGYIVVWAVSYVDIYQGAGVYAVRLDADGTALDPAPVRIGPSQTNVRVPTAAFDGTNWLVAWNRYAGGTTSYDILAARLGKTGVPVDATPIEITKEVDAEYNPVVTFDGTDFLVAWRSSAAVYGRKYGKDGKPLGARLTLATAPAGSLYDFYTAFDGTRHIVVFSSYAQATSVDVYARRFDKNGAALDLGNVGIAVGPEYDERPRVVHDGTDFLMTWTRSNQLMGARMNGGGGVLDAPIVLATSTSSYYDASSASDGLGSLVVNGEYISPVGYDVKSTRVGKPPAPGVPAVVLSKAANSQTDPAVAWSGVSHYAAWVDSRDGRPGLWGARLAPDGQPQPPAKLVSDAKYTQLTRPRVASDGSGFLVVFFAYESLTNKRAIYGLRVDAAGQPDAAVFELTPTNPNIFEYGEPDVSFDGDNYLVVWQQRSNDGRSIAGVRLPRASNVPIEKDPLRISALTLDEQRTSPSVAFDGTNYFVSWITVRPSASSIQVSHVYGTRVGKDGSVLDGEVVLCDAFLLQRAPRVAGDPKNGGFFVVWEDFRTALETADIYGARISAKGQSLDGTTGMPIATGTHDESRPHVALAGDDANWVVSWRDLRSKQTYDVYGAWVSLAGKNHDPTGFLLSAEGGDEEAPWLSGSAAGKLVLAYERLDPRTGYGSYRMRARAITSGSLSGTACAKNEECATRSCADGFCCSSECGGCGVCNVQPGTCTPRPAGTETPTCERYKCQGKVECPATCETDAECASNATCDPSTKTCVSRVICIDNQTVKDLTGKQTGCAPFKCLAGACRTQCGSVDDCATGFVCDYGGRCVQPPSGDSGGCSVTRTSSSSGGAVLTGALWILAAVVARRRRRER